MKEKQQNPNQQIARETYNQKSYRIKREQGICGICGIKPGIKVVYNGVEKTLSYCESCREKHYYRRRYAGEKNLCTSCLVKQRVFGHRKCAECMERNRLAARTARKEAGENNVCKRCYVRPKASWSKTFCEECAKKHNELNAKQRRKLKEQKICKSCMKRPIIGGGIVEKQAGWGKSNSYCQKCLEEIRSRRRAKHPLKKNLGDPGAWSKFRKKKGANEKPIIIGAREEKKEFVDAFGIFNNKKII
jgi:hypothetical protein